MEGNGGAGGRGTSLHTDVVVVGYGEGGVGNGRKEGGGGHLVGGPHHVVGGEALRSFTGLQAAFEVTVHTEPQKTTSDGNTCQCLQSPIPPTSPIVLQRTRANTEVIDADGC